jgi:hypothetical protein
MVMRLFRLLVIALSLGPLAACSSSEAEEPGADETTGDEAEEAAEETGEAVDEAADDTAEAVDEAEDEVDQEL